VPHRGRRTSPAASRQRPDRVAVQLQVGAAGRGGPLELHRREQHDPGVRRLQRVEELLQPLLEPRKPLLALERLVRAVADEDDGRLQLERRLDELLEALVGVVVVEPAAGLAVDGVAAPAQVADGELPAGVGREQRRFPIPVPLLALHKGAAEPDDAVAVLELEFGP
jgi:hypothetical protein